MSKRVLITGASSGFGRLTSELLLENGYEVIATLRDSNGRNKEAAEALKAIGAEVVDIDVTDEASVNAGVAQAGHIDILINNAGVGAIGVQETFTIEEWQRIFDVNVFGVQRMNRAVLPQFRERGEGTVVYISSLLGQYALPFFGPYSATKHAVEAIAESYRIELSQFGIESVIVQPGGYATDIGAKLIMPSDSSRDASYGDFSKGPQQTKEELIQQFSAEDAPKPTMVSEAILKLLSMPHGTRPFRTVVDGLGMGQPIESINEVSEQASQALYQGLGFDAAMLRFATKTEA